MRKMLLTVSLVFIAFISASQLRANNEANTLTEGVNNRSCEKTYRFFTDEDLRNVEASAKTEWGTKIVGMLKERVDVSVTVLTFPINRLGVVRTIFALYIKSCLNSSLTSLMTTIVPIAENLIKVTFSMLAGAISISIICNILLSIAVIYI